LNEWKIEIRISAVLYIATAKKPEMTIATGKETEIGPVSPAISTAVCSHADRLCEATSDRECGSEAAQGNWKVGIQR
jgi:hypothetical protein